MIDDGLTFYRLQAHFFSVNAEVIHGRVAVFTKKVREQIPRTARVSKRNANAREQSQESVGHA